MEIQLTILNDEVRSTDSEKAECTWHSKDKSYKSDTLDEDMICCTIGKKIDRFIMNDFQLTSKSEVDNVIKMLKNLKPSLNY